MVPMQALCSVGSMTANRTLGSTVERTEISSPEVSMPRRAVLSVMELIRHAAVAASAISTGSMRSVGPSTPMVSSTSFQAPNGNV